MNSYDILEETIKEYLKNKDNDKYRKKITSLFYLFEDDISKGIALQIIINNLKNTSLFLELFEDILDYYNEFEEVDIFFDVLSKTDAIPVLLNKYKKCEKLFEKDQLSYSESNYLDKLMYYIDILKFFANNGYLKAPARKDKSYAKTKIIKRLRNTDLKFNKLLEKINAKQIEDIEDYQGLFFHCMQIRGNIAFSFSHNDKKFIRYYLENISHLKEELYIDEFIPFILSSNPIVPFIKEIQDLIKNKYKSYFEEIQLEQLKLINKVNLINQNSINKYCYNATLTGDVININLANILIRKHLLKEIILTKQVLANCLKSIINEYTETFNLPNISLIIHTSDEICGTSGYSNKINSTIGISEKSLQQFITNHDVDLINTLFHELTHACQFKRIDSYQDYLIQKEFMISRYYKFFYDKNYTRIYYEMDARSNGAIETIRYLKQLEPKVAKDYEEKYIVSKEQENLFLNTASIKRSPYKEKYGIDSVDNIFNQLVIKHPQIIRRNEFFQIEYNLDGSKKTLKEMLNNYPNLKENEQKIFKTLLDKRCNIKAYKDVIKEIEESLEINNEISLYYVDLLINKYYLKISEEQINDFISKHQFDDKYQNIISRFKESLELRKQILEQQLENIPKTR